MSKSDIQGRHMMYIADLINHAYGLKIKLTAGDAYRDPRAFGKKGEKGCAGYGAKTSQHKDRLAHDFNLFLGCKFDTFEDCLVGGEYERGSKGHDQLGRYWESLHPECRWGGRYEDPNHYETVPGYDNRKYPL